MKRTVRSASSATMLHHIREIQVRLLVIVGVLIAGMVVGYLFHEPLFQLLKAPLQGPLHYTSPAGSFNFIIKICLMVGLVAALPVAVYNVIMFVQPALRERLSRLRVYTTTFLSLLLATAGASFAFLVIVPMALRFFHEFQVTGLEALISADDYLRFVVNVVVTFALIFQLPLLISLIDHITPLPPRKLLKAEKFIIIGSVAVGALVPFAFDLTIQLLIASPIVILYNLSIVIVLIQHKISKRRARLLRPDRLSEVLAVPQPPPQRPSAVAPAAPVRASMPRPVTPRPARRPVVRAPARSMPTPVRPARLITDVRRPARRPPVVRPEYGS